MFRTRPSWFAIACITLWELQLVLIAVAFQWFGPLNPTVQRWSEWAAMGTTLGLGVLLLVQLPRALQWRPRLNPRPNAAILAERQRIARDLHDNVGSQLVCAMVLLDKGEPREREIHALLEQCMLDLRLIVDNIDGAEAPFLDRLAQFRYRIEPLLAQRGIHMRWDVGPPNGASFPPSVSAVHLVAIVQEALSNALQHSEATEIQVSVGYIEGIESWYVEVSDNGKGIESLQASDGSAATAAGHGMAGMANRARLAGGQLHVLNGQPGGTRIRAVVPRTVRS